MKRHTFPEGRPWPVPFFVADSAKGLIAARQNTGCFCDADAQSELRFATGKGMLKDLVGVAIRIS